MLFHSALTVLTDAAIDLKHVLVNVEINIKIKTNVSISVNSVPIKCTYIFLSENAI